MRRLRRMLLNVATVLSLVLFVATVLFWVASYGGDGGGYLWSGGTSRDWYVITFRHGECHARRAAGMRTVPLGRIGKHTDTSRSVFVSYWDSLGLGFSTEDVIKESYDPVAGGHRQVGGSYGRTRAVWFSLWWPALLTLPLSVVACHRTYRRMRAAMFGTTAPGLCPACGYDLRATPDRCPECGHQTS